MNSIEVGVTHQIRIGREDAWVKLGLTVDVEPGESIDGAITRADRIPQERVMDVIESSVRTVQNYESGGTK